MDHGALREYLLHSFYVVLFCGLKKSKNILLFLRRITKMRKSWTVINRFFPEGPKRIVDIRKFSDSFIRFAPGIQLS